MKKNSCKIVVLSDLKKTASTTLKSAVSLAHMLNGTIEFFHVKKPTEIVDMDNQLSAIRTINKSHTTIEEKIQTISGPISKEYGIHINYCFSFGNVKNEIEKYLKEIKPDIVVLGKRKPKFLNLTGDSMTHFVLKNFDGVVMIASEMNALEPNQELSLGVLNSFDPSVNFDFTNNLMIHTKKPLKSFKIINSATQFSELTSTGNKAVIEYIFEQRDNAIQNLSKYLSKSNINLLCIDRKEKNKHNSNFKQSDIKDVIDHLNVSLIFSGEKLRYKNPV